MNECKKQNWTTLTYYIGMGEVSIYVVVVMRLSCDCHVIPQESRGWQTDSTERGGFPTSHGSARGVAPADAPAMNIIVSAWRATAETCVRSKVKLLAENHFKLQTVSTNFSSCV